VCFDPPGRDPVPERSLVPIRRDHGRIPLDLHNSADVRDFWRGQQIQLPVHAEGAPAPHHDQVHQSLPQVFHAEIPDQPDFQV
jgi:hypothetical protein